MYTTNTEINNQLSIWLIVMFWIISFMIIVGGLTRLTDSGLSITEWELFSGFFPPLNQNDWIVYFNLYKQIPEFKLQNYNMTLSEFKVIFWWEWAHRFLGRLIGIVFLIPLIYLFFKHDFNFVKKYVLIFLLICLQGFLGWYMVSSGLVDRVDVSHYRLSIHLFVAFVILSLVIWEFLLNINLKKIKINFKTYLPEIFLFLLFIQLILGAFVSGMDAGKIYNNWPLMGQNYYPDDSYFSDLFKLNAFDNPSIVQFIHRNMAYVILIFYLFMVFKFSKIKVKYINNIIYIIGIILFLQIFLGIFTLLSGANIFYSSLHQINTIFLFSSSIYFIFRTKQN